MQVTQTSAARACVRRRYKRDVGSKKRTVSTYSEKLRRREEAFSNMLKPLLLHFTEDEKIWFWACFDKFFTSPLCLRNNVLRDKHTAGYLVDYIRVLENPKYKIAELNDSKDLRDIELVVGTFLSKGPLFSNDESERHGLSKRFEKCSASDFLEFKNRLDQSSDVKDEKLVWAFYAAGHIISYEKKDKIVISGGDAENKQIGRKRIHESPVSDDCFRKAETYFWAYINRLREAPLFALDICACIHVIYYDEEATPTSASCVKV